MFIYEGWVEIFQFFYPIFYAMSLDLYTVSLIIGEVDAIHSGWFNGKIISAWYQIYSYILSYSLTIFHLWAAKDI